MIYINYSNKKHELLFKVIIKILIFFFLLILSVKASAQNFSNQGNGKVVLKRFLSNDSIKFPNDLNPLDTYTLYIKDFMVLRKESPKGEELRIKSDSLNNITSPIKDKFENVVGTISHDMTVKILEPSYLVDLKLHKGYALGKREGEAYYYEDKLDDFLMDNVYRMLSQLTEGINLKFSDVQLLNNSSYIAGEYCEEGRFYLPIKSLNKVEALEVRVWFTKNKWAVASPLNNIFEKEVPISVLSISLPLSQKEGSICYMVSQIEEGNISDKTFDFFNHFKSLSKEEWEDKFHSFNQY